jgi:hypothetical protein
MDYGAASYGMNSGTSSFFQKFSSGTGMYVIGGILVAALIGLTVYLILGRAETRPVVSGFYGGPINGTSELPCGRMSAEAEQLIAFFHSKHFTNTQDNLHDLRNLLSKMCCLKQDLMAPQQTITAVKELGFATHMDIQPVADLTARCFSKTIPERDLSIQFEKWRDFGFDMIRRLCTAANLSESEVKQAEALFKKCWSDVQDVAITTCLSSVGEGAFKQSPHEASPHSPEELDELRPYDGLY